MKGFSSDASYNVMKVMKVVEIVKEAREEVREEAIACDVLPVAMFSAHFHFSLQLTIKLSLILIFFCQLLSTTSAKV